MGEEVIIRREGERDKSMHNILEQYKDVTKTIFKKPNENYFPWVLMIYWVIGCQDGSKHDSRYLGIFCNDIFQC